MDKPKNNPKDKDKEAAEPASAPKPKANEKPRYLSMALVQRELRGSESRLQYCLRKDEAHRMSARISMVIGADGSIERVFVTPNTLQACMEPIVRRHSFSTTKAGRQQVAYVVRSPRFAGATPKDKARGRKERRAKARRTKAREARRAKARPTLSGSKPEKTD